MAIPPGGAGFGPDAAFASAAERFFELLKTFGTTAAQGSGRSPDWSALAAPLAGQFEQWLRMSQAAGPWFSGGAAGGAGAAPFGAAAPTWFPGSLPPGPSAFGSWPFGPLPFGPAAARPAEAQRTFELLGRLAQLQAQLATHWSEVANNAARCFVTRLGSTAGAATADNAMKLYELWVSCAEEAYAATAHREDFCRLQGELANTSAALLVEQRRHAETLVRAFGLPTRNEMDALYGQLKELRGQLAQLADSLPGSAATGVGTPAARSATAPRTAGSGGSRQRAAARAPAKGRSKRRPRA